MTDCCKRLQADQEFPSDNILLHMIKLYVIGDQVHAAFRSEDAGAIHADQTRSRMLLQMFESQLKEWKTHLPSDTRHTGRQTMRWMALGCRAELILLWQQWICPTLS